MAGHALPRAGEAKMLLGGGLNGHLRRIDAHSVCHPPPHLRDVGSQLRGLGQHRGVHVADLPAGLRQPRRHLFQKAEAVRIPPAFIAVGEHAADVAQRRRAQQRVHHRVSQYIRIGVAQQPPLIGNGDTAQNQGTALHQTVYVVAVPDAQIYHACTSRRRRNSSATDRSSGVVILIFSRHPGVK